MTDPTAAVRLRRLATAKQSMLISDAAKMVREFTDSFIAGDEPVQHQNTMELFQATLVLAGAWLDDHAADDAELITEEWVSSQFAERLPRATAMRVYTLTQDSIGIGCHVVFWQHGAMSVCISNYSLPHITTRGQLRLLLRTLVQEPQP